MTEIDTLKYELSYYKVINANLKEIIKLQKLEYKELKKAFSLKDVMSSKILIDKNELLKLVTKAVKEGFNTYEFVKNGFESFDAKVMAMWIINKYV